MKKTRLAKVMAMFMTVLVTVGTLAIGGCKKNNDDEYDKDGNLKVSVRNLYFGEWSGGDAYLKEIEDRFKVKFDISSYSWADWGQQVFGEINGDSMKDVFQFNLDNYNYVNYLDWVDFDMIKALPTDMSKWPNLKSLIDSASNVEALKVDGKLYCLPVVKNSAKTNDPYSPFTYVYRRDWAKELGVYQENDVYTWEQFQALLTAFYNAKCTSGDFYALADVEWGFPSVINFYKKAPHCFVKDTETNQYVSTYLTSDFKNGLTKAKEWVSNKFYGYDQYAANDGDVAKQYYGGRVGVFYENLSLSNYSTLRKKLADSSAVTGSDNPAQKLDDATAIMKVKSPDGYYCLEGNENWYSATLFSSSISDTKLEKILDVLEWLLGEEGTMMATYGFENYDYIKEADGSITLTETGWEKDLDGHYVEKYNGAKYLRYIATLGNDISANDPLVDKDALRILNEWYAFMDAENAAGHLRILTEDSAIKWLSSDIKNRNGTELLQGANTMVEKYVYGRATDAEYQAEFTRTTWTETLADINAKVRG